MLTIRSLLRANPQIIKNAVQQRNMSGLAVPARKKITKGETIFLAGMMMTSWLVVPAWVLLNLKNYRGQS